MNTFSKEVMQFALWRKAASKTVCRKAGEKEEENVKYIVNDQCIGCGLCTSICPEIFFLNDSGMAEAIESEIEVGQAENALESCPVAAIERA